MNTLDSDYNNNATLINFSNTLQCYVAKIEYGETAGYHRIPLIYNNDLILNAGETVTSLLDKLKDMLGDFEYFYDLQGRFIDTSRAGWDLALGVSSYSLISLCREARPIMNEGGSILALTYLGSEFYVANYNIMGVAKAALEASMRYLAVDLGKVGARINCLSAGPVKTLAAKGIGGFDKMLKAAILKAPMHRNVTLEDIGKTGVYLCSDLSSGVTGEVLHVDCGCHAVYTSIEEMEKLSAE